MVDPYRMVFINLISSFFVLGGTLIYRYIFPKKKINLFILLLIISILPVISLLRAGDYESGDFNIHIYRIVAFFNVLKEGILMPSWAADLNSSYGNPLFIFNYSFPYYLISLFHFLGIDFINGTKLYLGLVFYLSGIAMYFATKEITGNRLASFTASIFYTFNPYHLIDVHFRATLGESTVFLIVPLLFFFITKYLKKGNYLYLILNSLFAGIMVMAHPLLAVSFSVIITLYIFFIGTIKRRVKFINLSISSLVLGGLAASYAWMSFIIYKPYMFSFPSEAPTFYAFKYFFYSPWRYGFLFQGPFGELAEIIGYTQFLVLIILTILFLKNKIKSSLKYFVLFWVIMFLMLLFLMHPFSIFFWKKLPFFWMLLPYGRLSLIAAFCTSILAGYLALIYFNKKQFRIMIYILIIITIGYTILNWGHRRVIPEISEKDLIRNVGKSTANEGLTAYFLNTKWADINNFWFSEKPKNHLDIIQGEGTVEQMQRTSTKHTYTVKAKTPIVARENTLYFPGWSLKANNKNVFIYPGTRGVIYAVLPKGKFYLELNYEDIPVYRFFKLLSAILFSILLMLIPISIMLDKRKFKFKLSRLGSKP